MNLNRLLIKALYWFFSLAFLLTLSYTILIGALNIFTEEGLSKAIDLEGKPSSQHEKSYPFSTVDLIHAAMQPQIKNFHVIPVSISLWLPDSIIFVAGKDVFDMGYYAMDDLNYLGLDLDKNQMDSLAEDSNTVITILRNEINVSTEFVRQDYENSFPYFKEPPFELVSSTVAGNGAIFVKPSNSLYDFVLGFRKFILLIGWILIFYHSRKIFQSMKSRLTFSLTLIKRVKWIGVLLIFPQLIEGLVNYYFSKQYTGVSVNSSRNIGRHLEGVIANIGSYYDFNWTIIIVGLSLLVVSSLFKLGLEMEHENNLTI